MTSEIEPTEREEPTQADLAAARQRTYRSLANGLIIRASQYVGTFDSAELHPGLLPAWADLATRLHGEADSADPNSLAEHRRKYLDTITRHDEP